MKDKVYSTLLALLIAGGAASVWALSSDREQPINIEADQAEADDVRRVTIYRGDVIITQGTLEINGDIVTIHFDERQEMTKLVAQGKPAKFKQQPDGNEAMQNAEAKTLEFYAHNDTIVLLGNAVSWQGDNRIEAEKIVYDTRKGRVRADSGGEAGASKGRVTITIAPSKKQQTQE